LLNSPVTILAFRYLSLFEIGIDGKSRLSIFSNNKTITSILGLALGACVLLIVLSIVNGFEREMRQRILGVLPHVILHTNEGIDDWQELANNLIDSKYGNAPLAVAPLESFQALLLHQDRLATVNINGVLPEAEKKVSIIDSLMLEGELHDLEAHTFGIVLGSQIAKKLGAKQGDKIKVMLPEVKISLLGVLPRYKHFEVVGIFEVGAALDEQLAYIHLEAAQKLLRKKGNVSNLRLLMPNIFNSAWDGWQLAQALNSQQAEAGKEETWMSSDWTVSQGSLYEIIILTKSMLGLLVLLIVLVACFNLSSSLIMLVNDKRADIAILLSQGLDPKKITQVFIIQALIIALFGLLLGFGLAILVLSFLGTWIKNLEDFLQVDLTSAYPVHYLPSEILLQDMVSISVAVLTLSFLASLYPARQASKVNPAEELKYE